ncbi:fimbrillin family protein [Segatella copri]|uniref:fimbrillin family protein n=1 Tax=Segatella copri TaxID=165179 RepID=UPI001C45BE82|nr:fimbrillin family protein [Segatella copri]MBW0049806.1 fimbrillin family protein [Segatella copri]
MKAIKFFAISAMAAAMITSCSNEDELSQSNYPSDNIIRITAGVNNAKTRADESAGTPLKNPLSLTVVNKNTTDPVLAAKYTYVNKVFSKDDNGVWDCKETLLWQNSETPVDIVAFAPAVDNNPFANVYDNETRKFSGFSYSVAANQSTESDNNDLLYYYAQNIKPEKELVDGKLSIQMNHAFCMIDINVTLGTEFNVSGVPTASPITKVTLGGTITEANVNVTNGTDKVTASTTAAAKDITATKGEFETPADNDKEKSCISHFSCITVPQNVAAKTFKVSLKTADKLYEWTSEAAVELKSGYRYTLNLSMGNDVVLLKGGSITATEWKPGTGGSLETD